MRWNGCSPASILMYDNPEYGLARRRTIGDGHRVIEKRGGTGSLEDKRADAIPAHRKAFVDRPLDGPIYRIRVL